MCLNKASIYFPGLNALRFFAAFAVLISHVELLKNNLRIQGDLWVDTAKEFSTFSFIHILNGERHFLTPIISEIGSYGVVFFFVLSGFLITYLLLAEKKKTNTVHVGHFYGRRILRIWPLYFLIMILGFFILPNFELFNVGSQSNSLSENFTGNLILYAIILPNLAQAIFPPIPNIGQAWSIGVEEQFYLIWPIIVKKSKNVLKAIITVFVLILVSKILIVLLTSRDSYTILKSFLASTKIESMAIGALGAVAVFRNWKKALNLVNNNFIFFISILFLPFSFYLIHPLFQDAWHIIMSVVFLVILINIAVAKRGLKLLESNALNFLGKISYGIYMFHMMYCSLVINIAKNYFNWNSFSSLQNILVYSSITLLTIFTSWLSYNYFEKIFLKKKSFGSLKSWIFFLLFPFLLIRLLFLDNL